MSRQKKRTKQEVRAKGFFTLNIYELLKCVPASLTIIVGAFGFGYYVGSSSKDVELAKQERECALMQVSYEKQ